MEDAAAGIASAATAGMATLAVTITTPARDLPADAVVSDLTTVTVSVSVAGAGGRLIVEVDTSQPVRDPVEVPTDAR